MSNEVNRSEAATTSTLAARSPISHQLGYLAFVTLLVALAAVLLPASASAAPPPQLWQKCDSDEAVAEQCDIPRGIAADPDNGHVFVADQSNRRIVEFDALGNFVRAWGWDVVESGPGDDAIPPEDQFEVCVLEDGDVCKAGITGAGAGQFGSPQGVALDSAGNVYVIDQGIPSNLRVQKFSPAGDFLRMWGKEVNTGTSGNAEICTNAGPPTDVCGAGGEGAGPGQFAWGSVTLARSFIAIDTVGTQTAADDKVHVGDQNRIQRFDTSGAYQAEIALPGKTVHSLATDSAGNLYAIYAGEFGIHKLSPAGVPLSPTFDVKTPNGNSATPTAVAVDAAGHVYAFGPTTFGGGFTSDPIFEFDPAGNLVENFGIGEFDGSTGLATNLCAGSEAPGNLYVSNSNSVNGFARAYGTAPDGCFSAFTGTASGIAEAAATVNGTVNPKGSVVTECRFEYGTSTAYGSTAPCAESSGEIGTGAKPVAVHAELSGLQAGTVYHFRLRATIGAAAEKGADATFKTFGPPVVSAEAAANVAYTEASLKALVNPEGLPAKYRFEYGLDTTYGNSTPEIEVGSAGDRSEHAAFADLAGLTPGTTYHWRIVATNASGTSEGADHVLNTYRQPAAETSCPNQAFRTGPSAALPDCRAYEMVSPVDKNGGNIVHPAFNGMVRSSLGGEKITYGTPPAFGDIESSLSLNQYLAKREAGVGWSGRGIRPPLGADSAPVPGIEFGLSREFEAFSPDLCSAWFLDLLTPPLTEEGQEGHINHYRLDLCGEEEPEALTDAPLPPGTDVEYVNIRGQSIAGYSADASHAFFSAKAALTPEAAANTNAQLYDRFGGALHLVSILPDGSAATGNSRVGSGPSYNLENAVSEDGSRIFWTAGGDDAGPAGQLFLREHPGQGAVAGECGEAGKACTVAVADGAFFWAGASDGSAVLYSELMEGGEKLWLQEFEESEAKTLPETKEARRLVGERVQGVLGVSDDLARIYFVSTDALGGGAVAGEPNLYLDEEGELTYVTTLAGGDVGEGTLEESRAYNVASKLPIQRAARVSPDGAHIAFQSRAPLTGFENTDPESGKPLVEVFTYEAGGELLCVSCNPAGAQPSGEELREPYIRISSGKTGVFASAWIQTWEGPLYASNVLSEDGSRLFFHSHEALLPSDGNGAMDVYEWEAPGAGGCDEADSSYFPQNGGCLYLISSGESRFESEFWEASSDGRDVFFSTESGLVASDPALIDLYDAREGGGFPPPPSPPAPCEGEACQSPPPPPAFSTPASSAYNGPASSEQGAKKPRCPKGKRRVRRAGRTRCVRKRGAARRANSKRRAER